MGICFSRFDVETQKLGGEGAVEVISNSIVRLCLEKSDILDKKQSEAIEEIYLFLITEHTTSPHPLMPHSS
jgi:hypothetical protein